MPAVEQTIRPEAMKQEIETRRAGAVVAVIGVGVIGRLLAEGFLEQQLVRPENLRLYHHHPEQLRDLCAAWPGLTLGSSAVGVAMAADLVIVAVQPVDMPAVLKEISPVLAPTARLWLTTSHLPDALLRRFWSGAAVTCLPTVAGRYGRGTVLAHVVYGMGAAPGQLAGSEDGEVSEPGEQGAVLPAAAGSETGEVPALEAVPVTDADLALHTGLKEEFSYYFSGLARRILWVEDGGFAVLNNITGCAPAFVSSLIQSMAAAVAKAEPDFDRAELEEVVIEAFGSTVALLENEGISPAALISRVGSAGGITHTAMAALDEAMPAVWEDLIRRSVDRHDRADRETRAAAFRMLNKE